MKKNQLPLPLPLDSICAAFPLLGFWQKNKTSLLGIVTIATAILLLFFWLSRRRRKNSIADLPVETPPALTTDLSMIQIEGMSESGESVPATASPAIHGKIEVLVGGQMLDSYLVTENPLTIGRDPEQSRIIIQESIVSKLHCRIFARDGRVFVKDLNSTNGVYVNEERVGEYELKDNDEIFLGKKGTVRIIYHR